MGRENEVLVGIVEGLEAFENVLRGREINIHTDHLYLLYGNKTVQRMVSWRLIVEEFKSSIEFGHIAGKRMQRYSRLYIATSGHGTMSFKIIKTKLPNW